MYDDTLVDNICNMLTEFVAENTSGFTAESKIKLRETLRNFATDIIASVEAGLDLDEFSLDEDDDELYDELYDADEDEDPYGKGNKW